MASDPSGPADGRVSTWLAVAYGLPALGLGASGVMVTLYLPRLYVDEMGVPLGQIGAVTTAVQIFDAVTDPLFGYISDRIRCSYGRRRPFLLLGGLGLAMALVALFTPPRFSSPSAALVFAGTVGLITQLFLTIARIPWLAWAIELTSDYDAKTKVMSVREFLWALGAMLGSILPSVTEALFGAPSKLTLAAVVWGVAIVFGCVLCFFVVPDAPVGKAKGGGDGEEESEANSRPSLPPSSELFGFVRSVAGSRPAMALYLATIFGHMAITSNSLLYAFFVKYVLESNGSMEWLLGIYIFLGALFVPFWAWTTSRADKKKIFTFITLLQSLVLAVIFLTVEARSLGAYVGCIITAGTVMGGSSVIRFSMLADVADLQQLRTRSRDEGKLVALFDISAKLAGSALVALGFLMIDISGYQAGIVPQTPAARWAISVFYALIPSLLALLAALATCALYTLDRAKHADILSQLSNVGPVHDKC